MTYLMLREILKRIKRVPIFSNPFKKIGNLLAAAAAKIPAKRILARGTKAAALLSSAVVAGQLGHKLIKTIGKRVNDTVAENEDRAMVQLKKEVNKNLEKFIFDCVLRWLTYLSLTMTAYGAARLFNLRKDMLVAFVILGIYAFYLIKFARICHWYLAFCRANGWMFNPAHILRAYLYNAILDRVKKTVQGLSLPARLAMNFFGPSSAQIAMNITNRSLNSQALRLEAITRAGMWLGGWIIYTLVYEKLFLLVTDIDFKSVWEPVVWPFYMLKTIVSA